MPAKRYEDLSEFEFFNQVQEDAERSSKQYAAWKADGIARAAKLQSLYEDKVTVHFNDSPSEAKFIVTIGLHMEGDAIRLLDFAKAQGII